MRNLDKTVFAAVLAAGFIALPVAAQTSPSSQELQELDTAAEKMIARVYVYEAPTTWVRPSQVVAKLSALGYTAIEEFDVEYDHYEVEARLPGSDDEVEIDIDPITGRILEIEDNWF